MNALNSNAPTAAIRPAVANWVDYAPLIASALAIADAHLANFKRTKLSIEAALANSQVRLRSSMPIYGKRVTQWQPVVNEIDPYSGEPKLKPRQRVHANVLARTPANIEKIELQLLQEFQNLHQLLLVKKVVPATQIPALLTALANNPVITVRTLCESANISRDTAVRWLRALKYEQIILVFNHNGMMQYGYRNLANILDRYLAIEQSRINGLRHRPDLELYSPFR